jgi:hypothetical protein
MKMILSIVSLIFLSQLAGAQENSNCNSSLQTSFSFKGISAANLYAYSDAEEIVEGSSLKKEVDGILCFRTETNDASTVPPTIFIDYICYITEAAEFKFEDI